MMCKAGMLHHSQEKFTCPRNARKPSTNLLFVDSAGVYLSLQDGNFSQTKNILVVFLVHTCMELPKLLHGKLCGRGVYHHDDEAMIVENGSIFLAGI
jgi:hypothetical protein